MKFIKYIFATIAVSCLFTTSVFAANLSTDYKYTFSLDATPTTLEAGDTVTVSVYLSAKDASNNAIDTIAVPSDNTAYMSIGLNYNDDVLSIEKSADCIDTDTEISKAYRSVTLNEGNVTFGNSGLYGEDIGTVTPSTALVKFIFTVKDGVSTVTYDNSNPLFSLVDGTTFLKDTSSTPAVGTFATNTTFASAPAITVNGSAPTGATATVADTNETVGVTAYTIANDEELTDGKKVMTKTFENVTLKEASRVNVTIGSRSQQFGSDLFGKLGGLEIGKLTFGIIVDSTVAASDVTAFSLDLN